MTERIYLDHNATTPIDPVVLAAMEPYVRQMFGNPSSVEHEHGRLAAVAVEIAREQVASAIGARASEIVFTGSCTEANNLAILGVARANPDKRHIVTSQIEHPAVLEPARSLEREGWDVTYLPVDETGRVSISDVEASIRSDTALVSIMAANNEVGTIQPIREIGAVCASHDVLFHSDLAQIIAYREIDVERDNIHLASISAHKAYGPKGVGALYIRSRRPRVRVKPIIYGGGQERGLRSGSLNTPAIVGMGAAMKIAKADAATGSQRLQAMCDGFRDDILKQIDGAVLNGHPTERLPGNLSFSIDRLEPLALIRQVRNEISISAASACSTENVRTSHVLSAMFGDTDRARGAFRIAAGRFTTAAEMKRASEIIVSEALRMISVRKISTI
ncbi:cysteine desulfurase DndA [Nostoc sp. CHAB 5715]|nr:cysteine desulfurase DndA [Nostoc sp. CHAB 5715]